MSRLRIFTNPVDGHDNVLHVRTDRVLEAFKYIKKKHPRARIYLQPACAHNDVTPTNKIDEASLLMLSKSTTLMLSVKQVSQLLLLLLYPLWYL